MAPPNIGLGFPRPTKDYHTASYPTISRFRPELSLKGQTVLITGGATGIGLETTKAFASAGASTIVLLARSAGPMAKAKETIEAEHKGTKVVTYPVSITDYEKVTAIVDEIGTIDILVLNAATMNTPGATLDLPPQDAINNFAVNCVGPLNLIKAFVGLKPRENDGSRTVIFTTTAGIQAVFPGTGVYSASKAAMTYLMRCIDAEYRDVIRTFSFHPAFGFTDMARDTMGLKEDQFQYDNLNLPADFAVWLCSPEADFLKGRYVWSHWDVEELKSKKEAILNDPNQLTIGLVQEKLVEAA